MNCQGRNGGAQGDLCIGALAGAMRPPGVSCSRSTLFTITGAERLRRYKSRRRLKGRVGPAQDSCAVELPLHPESKPEPP